MARNENKETLSKSQYREAVEVAKRFGASSLTNSDNLSEGSTNLYFTNERVDDRVNNLLVAGSNISLSYNDAANTLTISATGGGGGGGSGMILDFGNRLTGSCIFDGGQRV